MLRVRRIWEAEWRRLAQLQASVRLVWRASPGWMLASVSVLLLQSVFPPLSLLLLKRVIDAVSQVITSGSQDAGFGSVAWLIAGAGAIAMGETTVRAVASVIAEAQGQVVADHIDGLLLVKSTEVELAYYENPQYHDTFHRAQQQSPQRILHLATSLNQLVRSGGTLLGLLVLLLAFHWVIVPLLLACVIPAILIRARYAQELHRWHERGTILERQSLYLRSLLTTMEPVKEVRLFNLGGVLHKRFHAVRAVLRHERLAIARRRAQIESATQLFAEVAIFSFLGFLAFQAMQGRVSLGGLIVYFWALQYGRALLHETLSHMASIY